MVYVLKTVNIVMEYLKNLVKKENCSIAINKFVIICNEMTTLVSLESIVHGVFWYENGEGSFDSSLLKYVSFP